MGTDETMLISQNHYIVHRMEKSNTGKQRYSVVAEQRVKC